mgnify:CR=1 FL=1
MTKVVEAIYEGEVSRPLGKLDLRKGKKIRIRVEEDFLTVAQRIKEKALKESVDPSLALTGRLR